MMAQLSGSKFKEGDFAFFGSLYTHCKILTVEKTSSNEEGFKYRYKVVFTNTGVIARKWEWELIV